MSCLLLLGVFAPSAAMSKVDARSFIKLSDDRFHAAWKTDVLVAPDFDCGPVKRRHIFYLDMETAPDTPGAKKRLKQIISKALLVLGYSKKPFFCNYYSGGPKRHFRAVVLTGGVARLRLDFATRDEFFKGSEADQARIYAAIDKADWSKEAPPAPTELVDPGKALFWAVSMRRFGAGWGYAAGPTPQKAAKLAIAECEAFKHIAGKTIQPYQTDPPAKSPCVLF